MADKLTTITINQPAIDANQKTDNPSEPCSICYKPLYPARIAVLHPCGHIFDSACIFRHHCTQGLLSIDEDCPMCRKFVKDVAFAGEILEVWKKVEERVWRRGEDSENIIIDVEKLFKDKSKAGNAK
ncbi:hypothetical protein EDC01DRAFT_632799 [Geopyxis carbonaria]|nr:hypothetical protein EDC01DRAFT_632799 [Geopyxis carbonaria]